MMELKELTQKVLRIFGAVSTVTLPESIMSCIFSGQRNQIYNEYLDICPDLSVDWIQRIYQYYSADLKGKKQDYTPVSISRLVALLTNTQKKTVYDCCSGSGSLVIQKWVENKDTTFFCEELDANVIPLLLFNLSIRNIEATVVNTNILTGEVFCTYNVIKGNKFASIQKTMFSEEREIADVSISNPPFNLPLSQLTREDIKNNLPEKHTCNFAFVENCLLRTKRLAAVILPANSLSSGNEAQCREYYIKKGWLVAAILLRGNMFESTPVATCILVFDKNKTSQDVMLVNASGMCTVEQREQRGEGDTTHYNRIYKKNFNTFSDSQLAAICQLVTVESEEYSMRVSVDRLADNNYSLSLGRYVEPKFEGTTHRDFNEIIRDLNRVTRERNVLNVSVNKTWAKELGLTELIQQCELSKELAKLINKQLHTFKNYEVKEELIEDSYIKETKLKIFCIENKDKEILSSIMPFFMSMWKQHIYYLNNEENRLLAELRDAMLPYLMNGTLELKDIK